MRTTKQDYKLLEKEFNQDLSKKQFGKRAHSTFFSICINHLTGCKDPNCHLRLALSVFCTQWEEHPETEDRRE